MHAPPAGLVLDIHRCALHDGPGIRSTVFLKGCPLHCAWCHNPESISPDIETDLNGKTHGVWKTVDEVMEPVLRDLAYYEASGGGLTVSGGEPLLQPAFVAALFTAARARGIHTCLDTCGHAPWETLEALLPLTNLILYDYKETDSLRHRSFTGVGNGRILDNLRRLLERGVPLRLRCPIIPGANDRPEHHAAIGQLRRDHPGLEAEFLPYHRMAEGKRAALGLPPCSFSPESPPDPPLCL